MHLFTLLAVTTALPLAVLAQNNSVIFSPSDIAACASTGNCSTAPDPVTLLEAEACTAGNTTCACLLFTKLSTPCLTCLLQGANSNVTVPQIAQGCAAYIANGTTNGTATGKPNGGVSLMPASFLGAAAGAMGIVAGMLLI